MRRSGFTLLELVVASALAALVLSASTALLIRGLTASQRMEGRLQALFALEKATEVLGEELHNAVALSDLRFTGSHEGLSFATAVGPIRLTQVSYKLAPSGSTQWLVRESQPFPSGDQPAETKTLVKQVVHFSVVYAMIKEVEGKSSLQWVESWDEQPSQQAALPRIVKVELEALDSKGRACSVTREFMIPHGILRSLRGES